MFSIFNSFVLSFFAPAVVAIDNYRGRLRVVQRSKRFVQSSNRAIHLKQNSLRYPLYFPYNNKIRNRHFTPIITRLVDSMKLFIGRNDRRERDAGQRRRYTIFARRAGRYVPGPAKSRRAAKKREEERRKKKAELAKEAKPRTLRYPPPLARVLSSRPSYSPLIVRRASASFSTARCSNVQYGKT